MLTEKELQLNEIFVNIAESLDISPSDYKRAVDSYLAVGTVLEKGFSKGFYPESYKNPDCYPQGSLRLGTIVRPIKDGQEADFDIDIVCELQAEKDNMSPEEVKNEPGNCLKSNGQYHKMLEPEGKRCWTLQYAESNGIGFHIDVLPCIPDPGTGEDIRLKHYNPFGLDYPYGETNIAITHKAENSDYEWRPSNPHGYVKWFFDKNTTFEVYSEIQKRYIQETAISMDSEPLYESVDDVPDELVRTPLQRAIQILKRHRDYRFMDNPKIKPISIIITTLSAELYQGEQDVLSTLITIINSLYEYSELAVNQYAVLEKRASDLKLIRREDDGTWYIPNPVNRGENFADRWHEDYEGEEHARAKAFFTWVRWLKEDLLSILEKEKRGLHIISKDLKPFLGDRAVNEAMKKLGQKYKDNRERDELKMTASTGLIGLSGSVDVKDYTFYGEE